MTDKELEFAAKAAGMIPREFLNSKNYMEGLLDRWHPRDDDGDAFRLMVDVGLTYGVVEPGDAAYTRLSIVRAAAEIGKATS